MPLVFLLLVQSHFKGDYCSSTEATGSWSRLSKWGWRGKRERGGGRGEGEERKLRTPLQSEGLSASVV